jgi:hypothetical protein
MLTTLFILSLIAISLWRPLVRALIAAIVALVVFAGIHVVRAIDAMVTMSPDQRNQTISVQTDALDDGGG